MTEKFVFDTNSLISSFLIPHSVSRQAFNKALSLGIIVYSQSALDELTEVMVRPKFDRYVPVEQRFEEVEAFEMKANLFHVTIILNECRDPKDDKFLELAVEAGATCIITGDKDLLVLNPFRNIAILTASEFLQRF